MNMKDTYIRISITYYSTKRIAPDVHYYFSQGDKPAISRWDMSVDEANLRMWKLVALGGENSYTSNRYNNAISTREVTFWGHL